MKMYYCTKILLNNHQLNYLLNVHMIGLFAYRNEKLRASSFEMSMNPSCFLEWINRL